MFKAGDRIIVMTEGNGHHAPKGALGTLLKYNVHENVHPVRLDLPSIMYHGCAGLCEQAHGQYLADKDMNLVPKRAPRKRAVKKILNPPAAINDAELEVRAIAAAAPMPKPKPKRKLVLKQREPVIITVRVTGLSYGANTYDFEINRDGIVRFGSMNPYSLDNAIQLAKDIKDPAKLKERPDLAATHRKVLFTKYGSVLLPLLTVVKRIRKMKGRIIHDKPMTWDARAKEEKDDIKKVIGKE